MANAIAIKKMTTSRSDAKPVAVVGERPRRAAQRYTPERLRQSIKCGMLLTMLENVAEGKKKVEPHQVTAAVALLRKVLPDLQATLVSGDPTHPLLIVTRAE